MNSGITIEELMDAQGLVDKNIYKRYEDNFSKMRCEYCPIDWSNLTDSSSDLHGFCIYTDDTGYEVWQTAPISKILALPERK